MCKQPTPWEKCVEFHGHVCPGLVMGFKAANIALQELGVTRARDEELVAIVENNSCSVDAIQVLTGCTFGKGNLVFHDYGKKVYTFGNRRTGEALRIAIMSGLFKLDPEYQQLKDKVRTKEISDEENNRFIQKQLELCQQLMDMDNQDFCTVTKVELNFPPTARVHGSMVCAKCGEEAMETMTRDVNDVKLCLPCADGQK